MKNIDIDGTVKEYEPLARHTTFKIGGPARYWMEPKDEDALKEALGIARKRKLPFMVLGWGSNVLFTDKGYKGIIIRLAGPAFNKIEVKGTSVTAGAGALLARLISTSCRFGLGGVEGLAGIPGTLGGAIRMNAGNKTDVAGLVKSVRVMDKNGSIKTIGQKDLAFGYRSSNLGGYIILGATLKLKRSAKKDVAALCAEIMHKKISAQPLNKPSAGCVFKNPTGGNMSAGRLIDECGLKGTRIGGAEVSKKHANFIVTKKGATARDVLRLMAFVKLEVKKMTGVRLCEEVVVI